MSCNSSSWPRSEPTGARAIAWVGFDEHYSYSLSHRPRAARDVTDYGLAAGMNMDVPNLHALFAAAAHVCQHLRLHRKGSEQLVGRVGGPRH